MDTTETLLKLIKLADNLRAAQKAYMLDRGNNEKGKAVGEAAAKYDNFRNFYMTRKLLEEVDGYSS